MHLNVQTLKQRYSWCVVSLYRSSKPNVIPLGAIWGSFSFYSLPRICLEALANHEGFDKESTLRPKIEMLRVTWTRKLTFNLNSSWGRTANKTLGATWFSSKIRSYRWFDTSLSEVFPSISMLLKNWNRFIWMVIFTVKQKSC